MDSNKFNSGFNTIADQFRNKGVASNKQRMAGDYLAEFTKDSGVQNVLGNKDYRNGVSNSKASDNEATGTKPSAVMNTLGAKPTPAPEAAPTSSPTPSPGAKVSAQPVGPGEIDYGAMADARMAKSTKGEINGGANRDYWINKYKKNNEEYLQNKKNAASYSGAQNWDEFGKMYTTGDQQMANYFQYTDNENRKLAIKHWEDSTKAYRSQ